MSTTTEPLSKWKHAIIIGLLAAAGHFLTTIAGAPGIPSDVAGFLGAVGGEVLIYDHSA